MSPIRSPEQDLAEAIGTLDRLNKQYAMSRDVALLLDILEARLTYALNPKLLTAYPATTKLTR